MRKLILLFSLLGLLISSYGQLQVPAVASSVQSDLYGPELVTNGTFDSDLSGWTVGASGWVWVDDAGEGKMSHPLSNANAIYTGTIVVGTTYKCVYTLSGYSGSATVRIRLNAGSGIARSANGTYEENITATAGITNVIYFIVSAWNFVGKIDDVSVKEVL